MNILHICAGWQKWNGAANIARMIMDEQRREGREVSSATWAKVRELRAADEVWIHCGWTPCLWWANLWAKRAVRMPEACYDPVRLNYHGWKKRLVGPIERWALRRCAKIMATCEAEAGWIRAYVGKGCPPVEATDIKRFFRLGKSEEGRGTREEGRGHLLFLGRRHLLKGLEYLERAVDQVNGEANVNPSLVSRPTSRVLELRVVSNAFGEEKERVWDWCDVLVLPTLSENFGLVIAEALERGKRVVTTDGAPAWGDGNDYGGRLVYLRGYRDGTPGQRVKLLEETLRGFAIAVLHPPKENKGDGKAEEN